MEIHETRWKSLKPMKAMNINAHQRKHMNINGNPRTSMNINEESININENQLLKALFITYDFVTLCS